jgi:hypothetical protein
MAKIINTGAPPVKDADPVTNHPAAPVHSTDTHPSDHVKPTPGGGGVK